MNYHTDLSTLKGKVEYLLISRYQVHLGRVCPHTMQYVILMLFEEYYPLEAVDNCIRQLYGEFN